ncbi:MAG: amphi-Trp domain-containing protein [Desulfobacterales bacterium]|nr:amphi-Trp domain-containing protein [Desulfobacterales bacterium]
MSKKGKEIEMEKEMQKSEVIDYLESIVDGLKLGKIVVQQGQEVVSLCPSDTLKVEVEAKQKKGKEKFSFKMEWKQLESISSAEENDVNISSQEPENNTMEPTQEPSEVS